MRKNYTFILIKKFELRKNCLSISLEHYTRFTLSYIDPTNRSTFNTFPLERNSGPQSKQNRRKGIERSTISG